MEECGNAAIYSALGIQRTLGAGPPVDSRIVDTQVPRVQRHGTVSPQYPPLASADSTNHASNSRLVLNSGIRQTHHILFHRALFFTYSPG